MFSIRKHSINFTTAAQTRILRSNEHFILEFISVS